ncbi:MAG: AAA family ATPase [Deltaproteobacteria bacterium]|nr:AAA family ATPase [Deltaproteobacteria bacterium]MBI3387782.1 AAA family ATPase [Deltaproteobacteria bacterium]
MRSRAADIDTIFVGRSDELAALREASDGARTGHGRLVLIGGESGIGKTTLLEQFAAQSSAPILWGRCWESDGAAAFRPWSQIIDSYSRRHTARVLRQTLGPGAADLLQLVPHLSKRLANLTTAPTIDAQQGRLRLFESVVGFLRRAASREPLTLVVEDLHRADLLSLRLLHFVARELASVPLLIIATYRDTEVATQSPLHEVLGELVTSARVLPLSGLSPVEVTAFVAHAIDQDAPDALMSALHQQTDGNPFYVRELVRQLAAEDRPLVNWTDAVAMTVPEGLRLILRRRVERLSPQCQLALRMAAVFGREFSALAVAAAARVYGPDDDRVSNVADLLAEAHAARIISEMPDEGGWLRFMHAVIRDTVYEDLSPTERARLHRAAADALESLPDGDFNELSHHLLQAIPTGTAARALDVTIRAARTATGRLAHEEAARSYQRALRILDTMADAGEAGARQRVELLVALGEAQMCVGETIEGRRTLLEALRRARELDASELFAEAALHYANPGDVDPQVDDTAIALLTEANARLDGGKPVWRACVLGKLAMMQYFTGTVEERVSNSREALALAEEAGDTRVLAEVIGDAHFALLGPDNARERLTMADRQIQLAESIDASKLELEGHSWRLVDLLALGDIRGVDIELNICARQAHSLRRSFDLWRVAVYRAMRALLAGRLAEAGPLIDEALHLGERAHSPNRALAFGAQFFLLRRDQGRLEEITDQIRWFADEYPTMPAIRCGLTLLYAEVGRVAEARAEFERLAANDFGDIPRDANWINAMEKLAHACVALGDTRRARVLYDALLPYAEQTVVVAFGEACDGSMSRALALLAALMRQWDIAAHHFEAALTMNARLGARGFVARTQHQYAEMLIRIAEGEEPPFEKGGQGGISPPTEPRTPLTLLSDAIATYEQLGMNGYLRQTLALREQALRLPQPQNVFRFDGKRWTVRWQGRPVRVRQAQALHYVAHLLRNPGRWISVIDLQRAVTSAAPSAALVCDDHLEVMQLDNGEPALDARALRACRARLRDLLHERSEASRLNDAARLAAIDVERDAIERQLRRGNVGNTIDQLRKNISKAIVRARAAIQRSSPPLGEHLERHITYERHAFRYNPPQEIRWEE